MAKKAVLQKDGVNKIKPGVTPIDKNHAKNILPEKVTEKKQPKPLKKSSALVAASMGRSAVGAEDAHSSKDVRGSSGLANTGTIISYD
jgi:predicted RNA-binding protein with PUA domain